VTYRYVTVDTPWQTRRSHAAGGVPGMFGGTIDALLNLQALHGHVVAAWEARGGVRGSAFRDQFLEGYKGTRKPAPEGYGPAVEELMEILPAFGITQAWCEAEADDVAATIAREWPGPHLLYCVDKDWLQLIDEEVHALRMGKLITLENFGEVKVDGYDGFTPDMLTGYLTLAGDNTDCIPGLPKVGKKRAMDILRACPGFVDLMLAGHGSAARAELAAGHATLVQWASVAEEHMEILKASYEAVTLYTLDLEVVEAAPDPGKAVDWLHRHDLGHLAERASEMQEDEHPEATEEDPDGDLPW